MSDILASADIVITSWLGNDNDKRRVRLTNHLQQLSVLTVMFPRLKIVVYGSGYTEVDKLEVSRAFPSVNHVYSEQRMFKFQKHNKVLASLYLSCKPKSILLLDDDAIPHPVKEFDINPCKVLEGWLNKPLSMPGPCLFFSSLGLIFDVYYSSREVDIVLAPPSVVGWAILVRNDLGVMQRKDTAPEVDDFEFRVACASAGKLVLKHQRLFFRSLQKGEKNSTLVNNHVDRKEGRKALIAQVKEKYPDLFCKGRFIWSGKDKARLEQLGILVKTQYGYVPTPKTERKVPDGFLFAL